MTKDLAKSTESDNNRLDSAVIDLNPIARELFDLAERLLEIAEVPTEFVPADGGPKEDWPRRYLKLARQAYAQRRQRSEFFSNPDLFGEPAWDIMLDLYVAYAVGKKISVTSACIASAVPATTGLRWLNVLTNDQLVVRELDAQDNRRVMVRLSDAGITAMERYFAKLDEQ